MSRFAITYKIYAHSDQEAQSRADGIALEQTVEIPRDVVPKGYIEDVILGKVETIERVGDGIYHGVVSYSQDSTGNQLPQLLNVIFGNSSIQKGIKVIDIQLNDGLQKHFTGAKFGIEGVRKMSNHSKGALISPVIKPQGLNCDELAEIAYQAVIGGAHIIKEDHGLTDQHMAPFHERVEKISKAVARGNAETGRSCLYFPNIAGRSTDMQSYAQFAKDAGAGGMLVMPGLYGFDAVWQLCCNDNINLPIMTHPSFLGPYVLSEDTGFTHAMLFGYMQRLCGSDISIIPNFGGRFGFSKEDCISFARACQTEDAIGKPIFPSPGGGMSRDRIKDMVDVYGHDAIFLLGGSLLQHPDGIAEGVKDICNAL